MKVRFFSIVAILLLTGFNVASAAPIFISAFSDGEIDSAGALGVTADTTQASIRTSRSGNNNIHHGAFVFDLSVIPAGALIDSVDFQVTTAGLIANTSATATVEFHGFASDNVIDASDFDSPTSSVSTLFASETFPTGAGGSPPIGSVLSVPLSTTAFQSLVDGNNNYMTLRSETVSFVTFHVQSLENTVGAAPPTLVVNTTSVPEPSALTMMLTLVVGVGVLRYGRWRSR